MKLKVWAEDTGNVEFDVPDDADDQAVARAAKAALEAARAAMEQ